MQLSSELKIGIANLVKTNKNVLNVAKEETKPRLLNIFYRFINRKRLLLQWDKVWLKPLHLKLPVKGTAFQEVVPYYPTKLKYAEIWTVVNKFQAM